MPRELEPAIAQREFVLAALKQGLRTDGRALLESRKPELVFGEELGMVECKLGKTRVFANVSATIVRPRQDRPYEGLLTISSEISPMASSVYEAGRASDEEVAITRMLEKVIKRSGAVDLESLCILAGQRVWHIRLTLHFLSDEGNMLDCACLAGITALRHFRRPEVEVIGEEVIVHSPEERAPMVLSMHHTPICITFALFEDSSSPVLDPLHLESQLATTTVHLALNAQKELCVMHKAGGMPLSVEEIMKCVKIGVERVREVSKMVNEALEEDWKGRVVEIR
ncbi:hypothetical protein M407DRAFT_242923 [Tulasnella calospora MUT 4182]|uniref:Exosome complex component RRP45 n=1 Tax=Tulasnella calospora MUT 4182 TaxID=1051891 RepID=A0A0C3QNL4_9AGAM|nr:hypothetical protein M407DRAFT_242923 [Tulasnella calospora MUT 4182]